MSHFSNIVSQIDVTHIKNETQACLSAYKLKRQNKETAVKRVEEHIDNMRAEWCQKAVRHSPNGHLRTHLIRLVFSSHYQWQW